MKPKNIIVVSTHADLAQKAQLLATKLSLEYHHDFADKNYDYALCVTPDFIGLQKSTDRKFAPFYIDFSAGKLRHRREQAGLRKELLARALGTSPRTNPEIVDATAGLGRDSFILATLGFHVTLLERSSILYTLLEDALQRAAKNPDLAPIVANMQLIHADAISWLQQAKTAKRPAIIYLDPMFPERKKSASVKKEMVILQTLLGNDEDSVKLFEAALSCATQRVVVKRPRLSINIAEKTPNYALTGKNSRFDIYLV